MRSIAAFNFTASHIVIQFCLSALAAEVNGRSRLHIKKQESVRLVRPYLPPAT
jgi:hypothetical protein